MALTRAEHIERAQGALAHLKLLDPHSPFYGNTAAEGTLHALLALLTPVEVEHHFEPVETPKQQVARAAAAKRAARAPKPAEPGHPLADAVEKLDAAS
jgi:hypothetical protein